MRINPFKKKCYVSIQAMLIVLFSLLVTPTEAMAPHTITHGSQGMDVRYVQHRLHTAGLYEGQVNGLADQQTMEAIRAFQRLNHLPTTGAIDKQTIAQLNQAALTASELDLLARLVYAEGHGEPFAGQVAIAAVVLNRVASDGYPNKISEVIHSPGAFQAVGDGMLPDQADPSARKAVLQAVRGHDPTHGSLYFFNPETATSSWIWTRPHAVQIGNHIFAR